MVALSLRDLLEPTSAQDITLALWGEPERRTAKHWFYRHKGGEKTPSLAVTPVGFTNYGGGGEKGGKLDLIQYALDCDREGAKTWLREYHGGTDRPMSTRRLVQPTTNEPPDQQWQDNARRTIAAGVDLLWSASGAAALTYLHNRGLTDDTIRAAQLGYDGNLNRIVIPCMIGGDVWYVKYRNLTPAAIEKYGKYTYQTGSKLTLYNADLLTGDLPVVFVEGEFDAHRSTNRWQPCNLCHSGQHQRQYWPAFPAAVGGP